MTSQSLRQKLYGTHNHTVLLIQDWQELPVETIEIINGAVPQVRIHVGESSGRKTRSDLFDEIDDLNKGISNLEKENKDLQKEIDKAEKEFDDLEEEHARELNEIECALEDAEHLLEINTSKWWIQDRIEEFANIVSEKIESLELDNRALAFTITDQNETIAELIKQLAAQKTKNETLPSQNSLPH